jgi:hypothetical protein
MDYDKELYEQQINFVDKQIDRLVYDLYGLTEEEIEIIDYMKNRYKREIKGKNWMQ